MSRLSLILLALLAACTARSPQAPALRDLARPVYSTASFDLSRLAGDWVQVAEVTSHPGCAPGRMTVSGAAPAPARSVAWSVAWSLCLDGRRQSGQGALHSTGPGRFALPGLSQDIWVLWADADDRTLVLGTPSGQFGIVLDRGAIPADRAKAAADILVWNGYAAGLLRFGGG